MPDDRTDEQLVEAFYGGNTDVFDILFYRYIERIRAFMRGKSWFKDDDQYIDELVGQDFEVLWQCLKDRKFKSQGEGSFRRWLFGICQLECYKQDSNRANLPKTTSTFFPASFANIPVPAKKEQEPEDETLKEEQINAQLKEVLSKLTPREQELMQMVADGVKYKGILKEFPEYKSVDSLKDKIYRIRQRFNQEPKIQVIKQGNERPQEAGCPMHFAFTTT